MHKVIHGSFCIFAISYGLVGCMTYQNLKTQEPLTSFEIADNYRVVYRKIVSKARECNPVSSFIVNADLFDDIRAARISSNAPGVTELFAYVIDIRATDDGKTVVELRSWGATGAKIARNLKQWATDTKSACDSATISHESP